MESRGTSLHEYIMPINNNTMSINNTTVSINNTALSVAYSNDNNLVF